MKVPQYNCYLAKDCAPDELVVRAQDVARIILRLVIEFNPNDLDTSAKVARHVTDDSRYNKGDTNV